ncbi:arsenate reductase ArsC [Burkholderia sp. 3C]
MDRKFNVLFLCRANAARSIMAEALLRQLAPGRFEAFSAGVEPEQDVHPLAIAQLRATIGDLGKLRPKSWLTYTADDAPRMDVIISMSPEVAEEHAPAFHGAPLFCTWNYPDPLKAEGNEAERQREFERVFRQILRRMSVFVALPLASMRRDAQRDAIDTAAQGGAIDQANELQPAP